MSLKETTYSQAIREAFFYLLETDPDCFTIGQGLWSPWYVGNTMAGLRDKFGDDRVVDSPVSELAVTGLGVGAGLHDCRAIVVHPRMDFMILAMDQIVNQAANWAHMLNSNNHSNLTIRAIINRGGGQGAQHSQALHAWFSHVPGLQVVMPFTVADARDLLIASVQSRKPTIYIDDRWLYDEKDEIPTVTDVSMDSVKPQILRRGHDLTVAAVGHSVKVAIDAAEILKTKQIFVEVIDLRLLGHSDYSTLVQSVEKTGRFVAIDGGWSSCGFAAELIAIVTETVDPKIFRSKPIRFSLPDSPAPASRSLEETYYHSANTIVDEILFKCGIEQ